MHQSFRMLMILSAAATLSAAAPAPPEAAPAGDAVPTFSVLRVQHETDYRRPDVERLIVTLQMISPPAANIAFSHSVLNAQTGTDDLGRSLARTRVISASLNPDKVDAPNASGSTQINILLQPPPPGERSKSLALLAGTIHAEQIVTKDSLEFAAPGQTEKVYGDVTVSAKATMQNQNCQVIVGITRPANMTEEQWQLWQSKIRDIDPTLLDSNGAKLTHNGSGSSWSSSSMSINVTFQVPPGATPAKCAITIIGQTKPIDIPYRVENIALP